MVAVLVFGHIHVVLGSDGIVFQFAHHLELHTARSLAEGTSGLLEGIFWGKGEGFTVLGVERAEKVQCGHIGKGVEEGGTETRNDIKVGVPGLDVGEQAAAVDTLTAGEHLVGMGKALDDEIQGVQAPVVGHVAEVDHLYMEFLDDLEDISLGELDHRFLEESHQRVGVELELFLCHNIC